MADIVKYFNHTKRIMQQLDREDTSLRGQAARYVRDRVAEKINREGPSLPGEPPGKVTGNLLKGLKAKNFKTVALIGFTAPAYHAALLEFGTAKMPARPYLASTMLENREVVKRIMAEERLP